MKVSMLIAVALLLITSASWLARVEAHGGGHRGGGGGAPKAPHLPKAGGSAHKSAAPKAKAHHPAKSAGGTHKPAAPKAKAHHPAKSAAGTPKSAKKDQKKQDSAQAKHEAKKKAEHREKKVAKAEKHKSKKEAEHKEKKVARKAAGGHDPESVSLLHAAHQALHRADGDYGGHRVRSMGHIGAALGHLGSSAPGGVGGGRLPQGMSDNLLREARMKLDVARARLGASPALAHAHGAVEGAIRELDLALSVR